MVKRKSRTIPPKVTRYYLCFHDRDNQWPYQLDDLYFRTFTAADKAAKFEDESRKKLGKECLNHFVAKVIIEQVKAPAKQSKKVTQAA